jgi:hypothetical protein
MTTADGGTMPDLSGRKHGPHGWHFTIYGLRLVPDSKNPIFEDFSIQKHELVSFLYSFIIQQHPILTEVLMVLAVSSRLEHQKNKFLWRILEAAVVVKAIRWIDNFPELESWKII